MAPVNSIERKLMKAKNLNIILLIAIAWVTTACGSGSSTNSDTLSTEVNVVTGTGDTGSLTEGLLAYYPFDGNANDTSDNRYHGEIHHVLLTTDRHNAKNSAYHFDGSQSYIDLKIERSTYPKFSMCTWYQYWGDINADHQTLFSSDAANFWVGKENGNSNIGVQEGNDNPNVAIGTNGWDGAWHHLCYVYDEGTVALYLDNKNVDLDNKNVGMANLGQGSGSIWLGKENHGNGFFFHGNIDEVRLYERALSPEDVNIVFTAEDNSGDILPLLNGVWEGLSSATQDAESTWPVKVTLSASNTLIDYLSLSCGGNLTLVSQTDNVMRFSQKLSYGLSACVDNGMVELTRLSDSELSYAWLNSEGVQQAMGSLTLAHTDSNPILNIINLDSRGSVTSDFGGINCGETCRATFETNAEVILTAVYDSGLVPMWVGCLSMDGDTCTVFMNRHRTVILSFANAKGEIDPNDSLTEAQEIIGNTVVTGQLNIDDAIASYNPSMDVDFFSFKVEQRGTFRVSSRSLQRHYILVYNEQQQEIGRAESTVPEITGTLKPGTYYVGVFPFKPEDFVGYLDGTFYIGALRLYFNTRYTLVFAGSVLGAPLTLDSFEENDSFVTAKVIETEGSIQGYLDTGYDADFFRFKVEQPGAFIFSSAHPSKQHSLHLYDEQQQEITKARSTEPMITHSLSPGTYYVRIFPYDGAFDLNTPYTLSISEE